MKLLMELFSKKNSSTGEAELCQTGANSYFESWAKQLWLKTNINQIISNSPKIMINSVKVHLGIIWLFLEVGLKKSI
jgi:hypothetical protein